MQSEVQQNEDTGTAMTVAAKRDAGKEGILIF